MEGSDTTRTRCERTGDEVPGAAAAPASEAAPLVRALPAMSEPARPRPGPPSRGWLDASPCGLGSARSPDDTELIANEVTDPATEEPTTDDAARASQRPLWVMLLSPGEVAPPDPCAVVPRAACVDGGPRLGPECTSLDDPASELVPPAPAPPSGPAPPCSPTGVSPRSRTAKRDRFAASAEKGSAAAPTLADVAPDLTLRRALRGAVASLEAPSVPAMDARVLLAAFMEACPSGENPLLVPGGELSWWLEGAALPPPPTTLGRASSNPTLRSDGE